MSRIGSPAATVVKSTVVAVVVGLAIIVGATVYLARAVHAGAYVGMPLSWYQSRANYIVTDGGVGGYTIVDINNNEVVTVSVDSKLIISCVLSRVAP